MPVSRRRLPPLNALRAFEVAGRRLNFRAAADELGVTQGAVAQQVRALEDHLGIALFQRLPRGVALTPRGAAYLADVTRAFDTLGEATGQLLVRPETVTISVTPTFAARLLIPRLPQLHAALRDRGITVDVVPVPPVEPVETRSGLDLTGYKVVLVPTLYLCSDTYLEVSRFVCDHLAISTPVPEVRVDATRYVADLDERRRRLGQ